jgi:TonB dependent receptor/Carboxypeptidase regulatory-like domain/TonB-dependent Receptor Plug Domain
MSVSCISRWTAGVSRVEYIRWAILCGFCIVEARAGILGTIRGVVHDPSHLPIANASVVLKARASEYTQKAATETNGEFVFETVPFGQYSITVEHTGFQPESQVLAVTSESAPVVHFQLALATQQAAVSVTEALSPMTTGAATPVTTIDRTMIDRTPGADRSNSLAMITDFVPGAYMAHDQLHIRGGHQVNWLVDGVPIPNTNIASNVGPQFDPKDIDYLEVQRGGYEADYGDRTYGAFNIMPRSGFERDRQGEFQTTYGNFNQTNSYFSLGDHTERFAWYGSLNGNRSDLGLASPGPDIGHDRQWGLGGFGTLFYNPNARDQIRTTVALRRDDYQIPNTPEDQQAGVRDNELERDALVTVSWVHTLGEGRLLTLSSFYHFNRANYLGGPADPFETTTDKQTSQYGGAQASYGAVTKRNNFRGGLFGFGQKDDRFFSVLANDGSSAPLKQSISPSGYLIAAFLEDQFRPFSWLALSGGVRLTHFGGLVSENSADPRAGAAITLPRLRWVLRGSYARYYQAPPLSTVSGPVLDLVTEEGLGFLPLHGERNEEYQAGLTIPLRNWAFDANFSHMHARNLFDHDALGNSNIFLPLTIANGRVEALEFTLRSPMLWRRGQVHLAYSHQRAQGSGGVTGGLTDFSPPEGLFLLDHDQQHTLSAGGFLNLPWHAWISGQLLYGSGFPDEGGPARLPEHTTFDLALGKDLGERWTISADGINVANRRFLLDNSLTFGGTHYFQPREIFVQVKYRFHF